MTDLFSGNFINMTSLSSIFVCFLCEAEYKDVDLLNEHMKEHEDLPGKSNFFLFLVRWIRTIHWFAIFNCFSIIFLVLFM